MSRQDTRSYMKTAFSSSWVNHLSVQFSLASTLLPSFSMYQAASSSAHADSGSCSRKLGFQKPCWVRARSLSRQIPKSFDSVGAKGRSSTCLKKALSHKAKKMKAATSAGTQMTTGRDATAQRTRSASTTTPRSTLHLKTFTQVVAEDRAEWATHSHMHLTETKTTTPPIWTATCTTWWASTIQACRWCQPSWTTWCSHQTSSTWRTS